MIRFLKGLTARRIEMGRWKENNTEIAIYFEMPEFRGTVLHIGLHQYQLLPVEGRLTDGFLDELIRAYREENAFRYELRSDFGGTPIVIESSEDVTKIITSDDSCEFPAPLSSFAEAFFSNVEKYAIYWAAPTNYRAFMYGNFDRFVEKMQRYRDGEREILEKVKGIRASDGEGSIVS